MNEPLWFEVGVNFLDFRIISCADVVMVLGFVATDLFLLVSSEQRFLPQHRTMFTLRTLMISNIDPRFAGEFTKPNRSEYLLCPVNFYAIIFGICLQKKK
jgi:hypothetical protein